jgi:hypothetical protein
VKCRSADYPKSVFFVDSENFEPSEESKQSESFPLTFVFDKSGFFDKSDDFSQSPDAEISGMFANTLILFRSLASFPSLGVEDSSVLRPSLARFGSARFPISEFVNESSHFSGSKGVQTSEPFSVSAIFNLDSDVMNPIARYFESNEFFSVGQILSFWIV